MKVKNMILLFSIILIFLIFSSYNISMWLVHHNYNKATSLNKDIEEVIELVSNNTEAVQKLKDINSEVAFMNAFCFNKEIPEENT